MRTEFYEAAVQMGFYGVERSGLKGKKDNTRKYWEDVSIKLSMQTAVQSLLDVKETLRIVDLGCGAGEGVELLTHIPQPNPTQSGKPAFVLSGAQIGKYWGVDLSPAMVAQGLANYKSWPQISFQQADLSQGFPFKDEEPFDLYFSSYGALSHLGWDELLNLTVQIMSHASAPAYMVFDLHGRFSPEWPKYWNRSCHEALPYNMSYLLPYEQQVSGDYEWFDVHYWSPLELQDLLCQAALKTGRTVPTVIMKDRSVFVGRHMATNCFKSNRVDARYQVNRLFDRDYRGETKGMHLNLEYLAEGAVLHADAYARIMEHAGVWAQMTSLLEALEQNNVARIAEIIESNSGEICEDAKMLVWLFRNAERFPTVDFWASVMGPQLACVLRNAEFRLPTALGCGHALWALVRIA